MNMLEISLHIPSFVYVVFICSWFIVVIRDLYFWLFIIQTKQNRLDRLLAYFKQKPFFKLIFSPYRVTLLVLLFAFLILFNSGIPSTEAATQIASFLLLPSLIFVVYAIFTIRSFLDNTLKLPKVTVKNSILAGMVIISELILIFVSLFNLYRLTLVLFVLAIIQPLLVLCLFGLVLTPNNLLLKKKRNQAKKYRQSLSTLKVIGITGSYGKTTAKEYLSHILSSKYRVVHTPEHINVDNGIADVLLEKVKPEHQFFIVEMGAYRKGEIASSVEMVKPEAAMITALGNQHIELFGSLDNIKEAKFELIDYVYHNNGIIVANKDSFPLVNAFEQRNIHPTWYALNANDISLVATEISYENNDGQIGMTFRLKDVPFFAPVIGRGALTTLLGVITMAQKYELSLEEISCACKNLPVLPGTMNLQIGKHGTIVIDDTYNASVGAVESGLQTLLDLPVDQRVLVFKDIEDLGDQKLVEHRNLAIKIAQSCTVVYIQPSDVSEEMISVIRSVNTACKILQSQSELVNLLSSKTAILAEGRGAQHILTQIL